MCEFYAFGDCAQLFEAATLSDKDASPSKSAFAKPPSVFKLPVRKTLPTAASPASPLGCAEDSSSSPEPVDGYATIQIGSGCAGLDCKLTTSATTSTGDVAASTQHDGGKLGKQIPYTRTTSFDTAPSRHGERDQSAGQDADQPAAASRGYTHVSAGGADHACPAPKPQLQSEGLRARSGGSRGSGGGAPPPGLAHHLSHTHHHHHHGGWHSTEWWRSFSSSRLNELSTEEPNPRSPEMRHVPYVGGAAPMCSLVHGTEQAQ